MNLIRAKMIRLVIPATFVLNGSMVFAQMGGGAPGGGAAGGGAAGGNAPAFMDPKFSDKLYEAGGPQGREAKEGAIILSVSIEGNSSISQNFILSTCSRERIERLIRKRLIVISAHFIEPIYSKRLRPILRKARVEFTSA